MNKAILRSLRVPNEGTAAAILPDGLIIQPVEVTAVDAGTIPPEHDIIMLTRSGEQIPGSTISGAVLAGGGSASVGSKLAAAYLVSGDWLLLGGSGGSSGSTASGAILPHSHMGGADGPPVGVNGTY